MLASQQHGSTLVNIVWKTVIGPNMRMGINSGSVVGGIVGSKIPDYYIFGITVRVALFMESSSKPISIQISPTTEEIFTNIGGFDDK